NIWKMGGLSRNLPITFFTFVIGALALIGCPPFSGFFSKDAILALAYERNTPIFVVGLFTAFLTAFYVMRLLVIVFFGKSRSEIARKSDESPFVMTGPLIVLALFLIGGLSMREQWAEQAVAHGESARYYGWPKWGIYRLTCFCLAWESSFSSTSPSPADVGVEF